MNREMQKLYDSLTAEERRKVDAQIHELFVKRLRAEDQPQQEKDSQ